MPSKRSIEVDFGTITQDNVEQLRLINTTCFPISYSDGFYKDIVKKDENLCKFAYHNGFVVGAICTRIEPIPGHEPSSDTDKSSVVPKRAYIMTLGVLAAYRGRGIGTKLVKSVLDFLSDKESKDGAIRSEVANVTEVALHVQTSNEDAIKFYVDGLGFEKGELVENYYKRIEPPHCYVLRKVVE